VKNRLPRGSSHNGYALEMTSIRMINIQHTKLETLGGGSFSYAGNASLVDFT
jgi:hypothetical protein